MNQVKVGAILNYIIIGINALVGLLYTPYMLHCLGQNEYGLYSLVASIIAYLTLLDFGFGPTVVRYSAKYIAEGKRKEQSALYGLFFRLYSFIGIIALAIGLVLYFNIDRLFDRTMTASDLSQAKIMILLLIVNLAVTFPLSVFGSIISAYERFIFQKTLVICRIVLSTLVLVLILTMGYKAVAMVIVQTVFNLLLLILNYLYCRNRLKIRLTFEQFNWPFIRELLGFSVWVFIGDVMFKFYYSTGQFVLGATSGTSAVAVFALGVTLIQMYIMFSGGISGVLLPRITGMISRNCSDKEISDIFIRVGRLQFIILSIVLGSFVIFGKEFISMWAGPGYESVYTIALIFFSSTLVPLVQNTGIIILQARNKLKFRSVMLLVVSAVSLLIQVVLSIYFNAVGCAVAVGLANVIGQGFIMNWYYLKRQNIDILKFWKEIGWMSLMPVCISVVIYFTFHYFRNDNIYSMFLWMMIYVTACIAACWRFSLNQEERKMLSAPFVKIISIIR